MNKIVFRELGMENKEIADRIQKARQDRRITQKEVAAYLGKQSSNAISEIERGNVNVTAEDISKLSELFNKPIMYFYGQDYPDEYTEDFIAILESLPGEEIEQIKALAISNSQTKAMAATLTGDETLPEDREIVSNILQNLNAGIYALSNQLNQALQVRNLLEDVLGIPAKQDESDS